MGLWTGAENLLPEAEHERARKLRATANDLFQLAMAEMAARAKARKK